MLKELVKERLMAAADEISVMFERSMASYEVELSGTREEKERQLEAVSKTHTASHIDDVQQLIGGQEDRRPQLEGRSSTLEQEDPQTPPVKEEEEEHWITQQGEFLPADLTEEHEDKPPESSQLHHSPGEGNKGAEPTSSTVGDRCGGSQLKTLKMLKELVKERLMAAADEISVMFERTIASYEEELSRTREEKEQLRFALHSDDVQQLIGHQKNSPTQPQVGSPTSKQEEPQSPHVKEEEEEIWISQEGEEADLTTLPLTVVSVKIEEHEGIPPESSQLHHSPSEENRGAEPPSSSGSSPQHMTTEADEDHRGGSQADKLLAPLSDSDDTTSRVSMNMESHMRAHAGEKPFSCSVCDKRFSVKRNMLSHVRRHTEEKLFSCSDCGKKFFQKVHMLLHMRTHTGEKPFSCSDCGKSFTQKVNMLSHMRTHTEEKLFSCSDCGKKFFQKVHMLSHMRTHTGEKPFSCSDCGKSFTQKVNMLSHMRTHTGEKPFSCSDCGKAFSHQAHMRAHRTTHTGEKPFRCSTCGDEFSRKSSLNRHMQSH